jgi:hypothetical protein
MLPLRELDLQLPIRLFFRLSFYVDQSNILVQYYLTVVLHHKNRT